MDRQKSTGVDPKVKGNSAPLAEQKSPKPQKATGGNPIEAEYVRLLNYNQSIVERLYEVEKSHSIRRLVTVLLCTFGVYCCWACEWVNIKFLIAVSAICIAVVAATLGSLWEKYRNKEVIQ